MFKQNEKCEINRSILNCDHIRYSPSEIGTLIIPYSQTYININGEDSVNSVLDSRIDLNFDVLHAATGNR